MRTRRIVSFFVWDIYTAAAIKHFRVNNPDASAPLINAQGIHVGNLPEDVALRLESEFLQCKQLKWRDQRPEGYSFDPFISAKDGPVRDALTAHREMSDAMRAVLDEALTLLAPKIEAVLGHHWSAGAARLFSQMAEQHGPAHIDQWPFGLHKIMIYPSGAGPEQGSTVLFLEQGPTMITGRKGVWSIFENSIVMHRAGGPQAGHPPRPTIEITILPAFRTEPRVKAHGIHVGYPWLPPDIEGLEGDGVLRAFTSRAVKRRSLLRSIMLAADLPATVKIPEATVGLGYYDI